MANMASRVSVQYIELITDTILQYILKIKQELWKTG